MEGQLPEDEADLNQCRVLGGAADVEFGTEAVGMPRLDGGSGRADQIPGYRSVCQRLFRREAPYVCLCEDDKGPPLFTIRQGVAKLFFPRKKASAWTVWFSARSGRNAIAAEGGITGAARHLGPGRPSASRALRPLEDRIGCHFVIASWRLLMILNRADGSAP